MKIGDKVRFLNEVGGGRIVGFQSRNIVLVEDNDGFEIPMQLSDVTLVESDDYSTARAISSATGKPNDAQEDAAENRSIKALLSEHAADEAEEPDTDPADQEITFRAPVEERKGGNQLSAYLAFLPLDANPATNMQFECYFVNDSNYHLQYILTASEGESSVLRAAALAEPNTKNFVSLFDNKDLNTYGRLSVQLLAYKPEKYFMQKPTVDVQFRIDPVKFCKQSSFRENDFFEQSALLYTIIENDVPARPLVVDVQRLKEEMYAKEQAKLDAEPKKKPEVPSSAQGQEDSVETVKTDKHGNTVIVVDLHAHELLETTAGMSNTDILNYQLKTFRDTMYKHRKQRGCKIIFIHGKGEGILRNAIVNELRYRYKRHTFQDASFQEYGYGATQVTI